MNEAVFRRYRRLVAGEKPLPQVIFIDGGKGQLSAAAAAMQSLDLELIMLVGLVKPPKRHNEISHLLVHGREDQPIPFDRNSLAFRLILQISVRKLIRRRRSITESVARSETLRLSFRDSRGRRKAKDKASSAVRLDRTDSESKS